MRGFTLKFKFKFLSPKFRGRQLPLLPSNETTDSLSTQHFHRFNSFIYWTYWGRSPKIERARLDGTERKAIISSGIQYPNNLALDEINKMLYWAGTDASNYGIIEALSLDGLNRTVLFYGPGYHPFSLVVFEGFVYWSDLGKHAVLRINKCDGSGKEAIVASLTDKPMGLKILHRRKSQPGKKLSTSAFRSHIYADHFLHLTLNFHNSFY